MSIHVIITDNIRGGTAGQPIIIEKEKLRYEQEHAFIDPRDIPDLGAVIELIAAVAGGDYLRLDGTNAMEDDINAGGNDLKNLEAIRSIDTLMALLIGPGFRYLIDSSGNDTAPIVDYSNPADGSIPGGKVGVGFNSTGVSGRYSRYITNLLTTSRNHQAPDADGVFSLILNTVYGAGWAGDTMHSPSADVLRTKFLALDAAIAAGSSLATSFDASVATTFPTGTATSKYRVTVAGTVQGVALQIGDVLYPKVDPATAVAADWYVVQANIDIATSSVAGVMKLYTDLLASNSDGAVTQAAVVAAVTSAAIYGKVLAGWAPAAGTVANGDTLQQVLQKLSGNMSALRVLPAYPSNDGQDWIVKVVDGATSWIREYDAYATPIAVINKLQAEGAGDWNASGKYVGTTSGAVIIGVDSMPGETFDGVGAVSLTNYSYNCKVTGWTRNLIEL